ncbi:hypothetical protein P3L10_019176 [Capsicum annuum]
MNLRELQKKFGRNIGLNLNVVRRYAKQLFCALKHVQVVVCFIVILNPTTSW